MPRRPPGRSLPSMPMSPVRSESESPGRRILITGGAGFIGSALVRHLIGSTFAGVLVFDKLTYAGSLSALWAVHEDPRYRFVRKDICDTQAVRRALADWRPTAVIHLAAESHVDRSIDRPADFIHTNIVGTYNLLECTREYWDGLDASEKESFRFLHVSTDEVYGSLGTEGTFSEQTPYDPRSPYSASKASADHLVRAWHHTFGLPVLITNCSNNYGPFQFPEKLIPVIILTALRGQPIPIYGAGDNVRDWLFVEDHVRALMAVLTRGRSGETYNIGGHNERTTWMVGEAVCRLLDELLPEPEVTEHSSLLSFVADRPGHDKRYAIDATKITRELGWKPLESFESGLRKTVQWYLDNLDWCEEVMRDRYGLERLGLRAHR